MMKKATLKIPVILATLFCVYSVILFVIPFEKNNVFWISYLATLFAVLAQLYIARVAFCGAKTVKSKFYGFPIIRVGTIYLGLQAVAGVICIIAAPVIPIQVPVIAYTIIIAFAIIGTISAETMREEIERQDDKLQVDVATMRNLQSQANALVGLCKEDAVLEKVKAFAEELRYSDPVSSKGIQTLEMELDALIGDLQSALMENDVTSAGSLLAKLKVVLAERNRVCKLGK